MTDIKSLSQGKYPCGEKEKINQTANSLNRLLNVVDKKTDHLYLTEMESSKEV